MHEKYFIFYVISFKVTVVSGYRPGTVILRTRVRSYHVHTLQFFHIVNLWKIPEIYSGMEECKIPAWAWD